MKDYRDLINKLQEYYETGYSTNQVKEINDYLIKRKFPISALQNLYEILTESYSDLPDKSKFRIKVNQILGEEIDFKKEKLSEYVYKQIPEYALELGQSWSAQKILDHVKFLRDKQQKLWNSGLTTSDMKTEELSFIYMWGDLEYVIPEKLEIAKNRIVEQGKNASLIDLVLLEKPIKTNEERKEKTVKIKTALEDIIV